MKKLLITITVCITSITITRCLVINDIYNYLLIYISIILIVKTIIACCLTQKKKKTSNKNTDINNNSKNSIKQNNFYIDKPIIKKNETLKNYNFEGKVNFRLLTNNEYVFFYQLKRITDKYKLLIFPKIRMADIFRTNNTKEFNKIAARHIDFTIWDKYGTPMIFIELDDSTHNKYQNRIRDMKKNTIFEKMNIQLNRIKLNEINKGLYDIGQQILDYNYKIAK